MSPEREGENKRGKAPQKNQMMPNHLSCRAISGSHEI